MPFCFLVSNAILKCFTPSTVIVSPTLRTTAVDTDRATHTQTMAMRGGRERETVGERARQRDIERKRERKGEGERVLLVPTNVVFLCTRLSVLTVRNVFFLLSSPMGGMLLSGASRLAEVCPHESL